MPTAPRSTLRTRNIVVGAVVVVAIAALLLVWNRDSLFPGGAADPSDRGAGVAVTSASDRAAAEQSIETGPATSTPAVAAPEGLPDWPGDLSRPGDCAEIESEVAALCRALDDQPKVRVAGDGDPCGFLRQVLRDLAASPPSSAGELEDPDVMLANVFHLFRVLGAKRMAMLKNLFARERDLVEPAALVVYRWWISRDECESGEQDVHLRSLYEYAGFAIGTLGGQAYLRRRAPDVEALVCFFSLQAIDLAIENDYNPLGIDPLPEISRCIGLVSTQPLAFSDRYRNSLEAMERRWEARRPAR